MIQTQTKQAAKVNWGNVLESKLNEWKGGSRHPHGIAEYINNSDDSYRRLGKYSGKKIFVEIHTRSAKRINKLIIRDTAEGMSFDDLENNFFQYFESYSGRDKGAKVRGQFGTGGKAYAIMNFKYCWIESVKNGLKSKARFFWDPKSKEILKEYDHGGFINKPSDEPNGTIITLEEAYSVKTIPEDFVEYLEKLPGLRHVLKEQNVHFSVIKKGAHTKSIELKYRTPDVSKLKETFSFELPDNLKNRESSNKLVLNYYKEPLKKDAFIDISDGISSIEDLEVSKLDGRPFSSYINGQVIFEKLVNSSAISENRRGLEEGDDLTEEIIEFVKFCVISIINKIEKKQKEEDQLKRLEEANKKLDELSKFLSKRDLQFNLELKELKKRFSKEPNADDSDNKINDTSFSKEYRKPEDGDKDSDIVSGRWVVIQGDGPSNIPILTKKQFIPDENGPDKAVKVGRKKANREHAEQKKKGIQVMFSNDSSNPKSPTFTQYDEPVSDRDLETKGIIWINSNHPIISKNLNTEDKIRLAIRDENIANYVLMIIAQYHAIKQMELQPDNDAVEFMSQYRIHFFGLQKALRTDVDTNFFDSDS